MIWLIGNKGMLGTELSRLLDARGLEWTGTDREVSMLDTAALEAFAAGRNLDWVINCAAYTAVDKAEEEETLALALNAEGPENIARLCTRKGARMLHISTDYVFDGNGKRPYLETDPVCPQGAYGRTKAAGETRVLAATPNPILLRTAWLYGEHGPNFVSTMLRLMREKEEIGVVADQYGSPTWALDLSTAIADIVTRPDFPSGIWHYTNAGQTTWHGFALEIHRQARGKGILPRDCRVNALTTDQYPTKTRRPAYSVLSKVKITARRIPVPDWKTSLSAYLDSLTVKT